MQNRLEAKILQNKKELEPVVESMQQRVVKIQTESATKLTNINTLFIQNVSENKKIQKDSTAQKDMLKSLEDKIKQI